MVEETLKFQSIVYSPNVPERYLDKFIGYVNSYLSKISSIEMPVNLRLAEDIEILNGYVLQDGFDIYTQFEKNTLGSYLVNDGQHFVYVLLTANMNTDVFTFCHEIAHAIQFEKGILVKRDGIYLTRDTFYNMNDIEKQAMKIARDIMYGDL